MTSRPRFRRASILTALVGVLATLAATLVAGPATATNSGSGNADQGLAFYRLSTSVPGSGVLWADQSGSFDVTVKAVPGGTNVQQPIDKALIYLPSSFSSVAVSNAAFRASNDGYWTATVTTGGNVLIDAVDTTGGREGLWPGDSVTVSITVTPIKANTYTIPVSAAVQHDVTDPNNHADQIGPDPTVTVGNKTTCEAGTDCTGTTHGVTVTGNANDKSASVTTYIAPDPSVFPQSTLALTMTCGQGSPVLVFNVSADRSKTITEVLSGDHSSDYVACWGSPDQFYVPTGKNSVAWATTTNPVDGWYEGLLPTCKALKISKIDPTAYPCVDSATYNRKSGTTTIVILAPAGDPRLTGF